MSVPGSAPAAPRDLRLCLLGFGSVARELCRLLDTQEAALGQAGLRVLVTAVGTRRGSLLVLPA